MNGIVVFPGLISSDIFACSGGCVTFEFLASPGVFFFSCEFNLTAIWREWRKPNHVGNKQTGFRTWCFLIRTTSTEPAKWQLEISGLPQKIINNCLTTAFWKLQCIRQRKLGIEIQICWSGFGALFLYS